MPVRTKQITGEAFGTLSAFIEALKKYTDNRLRVLNYAEHALSAGTQADAIAYLELDVNGVSHVGVATSQDNCQFDAQGNSRRIKHFIQYDNPRGNNLRSRLTENP